MGDNEFQMQETQGDIRVRFETDDDGNRTMAFQADDDDPIVSAAYEPVSYTSEELQEFAGDYFSEELNVTYALKMMGEELMLYLDGNEKSAMESIKANTLSNDDYGVFEFSEDANGVIEGFRLMAGRVRNLKFVKN